MPKLYLINVGTVWFPCKAKFYDREITKERARELWKVAFPEHEVADVIDAPESDVDGKPLSIAWGRSYKQTPQGFKVYAEGRRS